MQQRKMETRVVRAQSHRAAKQSGNTVYGRGITFNALSHDLGGFREQFSGRKLTIDPSFRLLWNHDTGAPLASIASGLSLQQRADGLYYSAPLPATTVGADVKVLIEDEIASEVSFGFIVDDNPEAESWEQRNGQVIRTVHAATVLEISILGAQAAYSANTVDLRNAPRSIREALQPVCQHSSDERSGITCSTCSSAVVDDECLCADRSLRDFRCLDCGLPVDDDDELDDESMDTERSLLLLNLNRRRQS